jgi:hypothetical protein
MDPNSSFTASNTRSSSRTLRNGRQCRMPRALGRGARAPRTADCSTAVLDLEPGRGSGAVQLGIEEGTRTTCGCRRRRRVFGRLSNGGGARGRVRGNLCRSRNDGARLPQVRAPVVGSGRLTRVQLVRSGKATRRSFPMLDRSSSSPCAASRETPLKSVLLGVRRYNQRVVYITRVRNDRSPVSVGRKSVLLGCGCIRPCRVHLCSTNREILC